MILLREALNTKYLTKDYADDVEFMLSKLMEGKEYNAPISANYMVSAINKGVKTKTVKIDIADCRFVQKVWDVFERYIRDERFNHRLQIIDSEDSERNRLLMAIRNQKPVICTRKLPTPPLRFEAISSWVYDNFSEDEIYDYNCEPYIKHPELIVFIQLARPSLKLAGPYRSVFKYVKERFTSVLLNETTDFLYLPTQVDVPWDTSVDPETGLVHVVNIGDFTVSDFVQNYDCIPMEIGTKTYVYTSSSQAWKDAVNEVLADIASFYTDRESSIDDWLEKEYVNDD